MFEREGRRVVEEVKAYCGGDVDADEHVIDSSPARGRVSGESVRDDGTDTRERNRYGVHIRHGEEPPIYRHDFRHEIREAHLRRRG